MEDEVERSGFLHDDESVGILSGTDEGVFGWFTLNFLLDRLKHIRANNGAVYSPVAPVEAKGTGTAVAAMDLGGGSTQVTFLPHNFDQALRGVSRHKYSHKLRIFGKEVRLYTHSYLGNGLVAARLGVAKLLSPKADAAQHHLHTNCLPPGYRLDDWDYAGRVWIIEASPNAGFEECLATTREYVMKVTGVRKLQLEDTVDIYAFSYFFDRAVQAGLVEESGGPVKVGDYRRAAERACSLSASEWGPEHWRPWQCLDLSYIYSLLKYGYGLEDERRVNVSVRTLNLFKPPPYP